jgi:rhodanese-related sulfurtransferase
MGAQGDYSPQALERLKFRRQFLLGPEFIAGFPEWKRIDVDGKLRLSVHPDLEAYQAASKGRSITLLGYILDPNNPGAGNSDVVNALLPKLDRISGFWEHTSDLGGRWILIVNDGEETVLFNDAAGLRQVCYTQPTSSRKAFCASQPGLIAEALELSRDEEALAFIDSREYDDYEIYWLPGDTTLYKEIKLLLPNHYLNVRTGEAYRYWPSKDLKRTSRRGAFMESFRLLRGLMESIRQRYDLALSLTAGWDSRVMLALSKEIVHDLYCFTLVYPHTENTRDVYIPAALLRKLGLKHWIIRYPEYINTEFKEIYRRNRGSANEAYCADAQAVYDHYPHNRVCVTGDVAEVVKCHYRLPKDRQRGVSAQDLADLCRIGNHPFLIRAFERWLSAADPHNVHLLDLFCWEQMAGRWQALIRAQYDIVQESFAPFNCRSLLVTMLSVDEDYRRGPEHGFLKELIRAFWPQVLSVPINPRERIRPRTVIAGILNKLGVYQFVPEPIRRLGKSILK